MGSGDHLGPDFLVLVSLVDDQFEKGFVDAVGAVDGPVVVGATFAKELNGFGSVLVGRGAPAR
jgi:hypothetical protein